MSATSARLGTLHRVYLVPGFFGFASFGELSYFAHVRDLLLEDLAAVGLRAEVLPVHTAPTASIATRAARLLAAVASAPDDVAIHLVGHSSGGLDARLFASGAALPGAIDAAPHAERVRSVVTVATPHRGTPLARVFSGVLGQSLLEILSLATMYTLRFGRLPLVVLTKMLGVFTRLDDLVRLKRTVLDQLYGQLLGDFSVERQRELAVYFGEVRRDRTLIDQLRPENMAEFDQIAPDRLGVRYASVVARGRRPGLGTAWSAGLDPYAHATHALYAGLFQAAGRMPGRFVKPLEPEEEAILARAFEAPLRPDDSDGVVPTLSQVHGQVLLATTADHLDLIGHFDDGSTTPPHFDWLASGSRFRRAQHDELWSAVARFIAES